MSKIIILLFFLLLIGCDSPEMVASPTAMLSISSNGRYVLSTHYGRTLILWDIEKRTSTILAHEANIFSPYFIKNTNYFMWQNAQTLDVTIQDVQGHILQTFNPGFAVFGHVMNTALDTYIASDINWSLYRIKNHTKKMMKGNDKDPGYLGGGILLNLTLVDNLLLTSGYTGENFCTLNCSGPYHDFGRKTDKNFKNTILDDVILWDINKAKPISKYLGTVLKAMATLSPNKKYVVSGDENAFFYLWDTQYGKRITLDEPTNPHWKCHDNEQCKAEVAEAIRTKKVIPNDFYAHPWANGSRNVAVKFIDEDGRFIRFIDSVNYATLYQVNTPEVQAYMPLGENPKPHVYSVFTNANTIDTAPKAHILAMAQLEGTGIIVYRFNETSQQLERLWAPVGPKPHRAIENKDNPWER